MDLHALEQFLVVARLEHLSRAAGELRVAQPSLSRTIARLEAELGAPLFDRAGRLRLNESGRLFRDHVERSLGELEAGRRAVAEAARDGVGGVRLASETFLTITGPLAAFKDAHPDVDVDLRQMPASDMHRALHAREVDLCVASQPIPADGLAGVRLHDEPVWLAAPPGHPLASRARVEVAELRTEPFVIARPGHWQRRLLDRLFAGHDLTPRIVCEGDEPAALAGLVSAGIGLTLVPAMARGADVSAPCAWIGVDDPGCRRTLTLHRVADGRLSAAARLMHSTLTTWPWHTAGDAQR
ncbi:MULTISPECIES: LysR family transcriptional regulator [Streptomyces]|jgi:DNA-binding transcriptional LysR family regulator|uniref:LysR family transcriptional regulator n=1 Tax=Streptomyces TaxID=1883 RepID=UPI001CE354DD|nr:LysR family transcriptional regulator [Streptomyces solaniscabiei]